MILPIIAPTSVRYEQWCAPLYRLLGKLWPEHPPVLFVSEKSRIAGCDTLAVPSGDWVYRLMQGVRKVRELYPDATHAMLMLEETFPLHAFDARKVLSIARIAKERRFNCVSFNPSGEYVGWKKVRAGGHVFFQTPRAFKYYNQNSTGIWDLSHLDKMCHLAHSLGFSTGWQFESLKATGHFVVSFPWPNVANGIFYREWVNPKALQAIQLPQGAGLKRSLERVYRQQLRGDVFARRRNQAEMNDLSFILGLLSDPVVLRSFKVLEKFPMSAKELAQALAVPLRSLRLPLEELAKQHVLVPANKTAVSARRRLRVNPCPEQGNTHAQVIELVRNFGDQFPTVRRDRAGAKNVLLRGNSREG